MRLVCASTPLPQTEEGVILPSMLLALDAGTTSTRAIAFDLGGAVAAQHGVATPTVFPHPGWVEQDAAMLVAAARTCLDAVAARVGAVTAIGIANQRETAVAWDADSGQPLGPAIVWQDRRTAPDCAALIAQGFEPDLQARTGLLLDPYFSATKFAWLTRHRPEVADAARRGTLRLGTVDAWLLWSLAGVHATDVTNASRTALMNLATSQWDAELCARFGVPIGALPAIAPSIGRSGSILIAGRRVPVTGCAGDQQAATIGQGCLKPGQVKCTYGTGIFALANAGAARPHSAHRLLATPLPGGQYALEGAVFVGGSAVQWLRDGLGLLDTAAQSEAMARSVPDTHGVTFVPALSGLGSPHWRSDATGMITGLTAGVTRAHIVRATLEAQGQQTADLLDAVAADGVSPAELRVDGGMVANDWLCQDLADLLGLPVARAALAETTALGVAMLAGVGAGAFADLPQAAHAMRREGWTFTPAQSADQRQARRAAWHRAIGQVLAG